MPTSNTWDFLKATRFYALVIGAVALYAKGKGWIGDSEVLLITTIMGGFITVRTIDRFSDPVSTTEVAKKDTSFQDGVTNQTTTTTTVPVVTPDSTSFNK